MDISHIYKSDKDIWGDFQEYKNIKFYPLRIKEIEMRNKLYSLFSYPKNHIPDKTILKMSYFKYIIYVISHIEKGKVGEKEEEKIAKDLENFIKHVVKSQDVFIGSNIEDKPNTLEEFKLFLNIDGIIFDESEFDVVREIVLKQNGISSKYIDEFNPELEKKLQFENKDSNEITFEDEIFTFCAMSGKSPSEIQDYTLYQFKTMMSRMSLMKNYDLYKPLESSGQISFKNGGEITHYLSHIKEAGRYDSILINKDSYVENSDIFKATGSSK